VVFRVWQSRLNVGNNTFSTWQKKYYEKIGGLRIDVVWKNTKPN